MTASVSFVGTDPSEASPGNLVFAFVMDGDGFGSTIPSGWTALAGLQQGYICVCYWTEGQSTDFTPSSDVGAYGTFEVTYLVYSEAYLASITAQSTNYVPSTPAVPVAAGEWVLSVAEIIFSVYSSYTPTQPSGFTLRQEPTTGPSGTPGGPGTPYYTYVTLAADSNGASPPPAGPYPWSVTAPSGSNAGVLQTSGNTLYTIVLSSAQTPTVTLNSPANGGYVDDTQPVTFTAAYGNDDGSSCVGWQFRGKVSSGGSYSYWNAGTSAMQSTPVWNPGSPTVTLPGSTVAGTSYNWSFNVQSSYDPTITSGFANDRTVTGIAPPTCTATGPTGTVKTSTPTVTATASAGAYTVTGYRVAVYPQSTVAASGFQWGQPGAAWDSGVVAGGYPTGGVTVGSSLANVTEFVAGVQVTEAGGVTSQWSMTTFTTGYGIATTPTLSAAATSTGQPGIELTVGDLVAGAILEIATLVDGALVDTAQWAAEPVTATTMTFVDVLQPLGQPITYQARQTSPPSQANDYVQSASGWSAPATAATSASGWVLADPANPDLWLLLDFQLASTSTQTQTGVDAQEITDTRPATTFRPFGRTNAVVQSGPAQSPTMTVGFLLTGLDDPATLDTMWANGNVTLLRSDLGAVWYVDLGATRAVDVLRTSDRLANPQQGVLLTFTVVDAP